jgi:hypothetical protein
MFKTHGIAHALENGQKKRASSATLEEETKGATALNFQTSPSATLL